MPVTSMLRGHHPRTHSAHNADKEAEQSLQRAAVAEHEKLQQKILADNIKKAFQQKLSDAIMSDRKLVWTSFKAGPWSRPTLISEIARHKISDKHAFYYEYVVYTDSSGSMYFREVHLGPQGNPLERFEEHDAIVKRYHPKLCRPNQLEHLLETLAP